MHKICIEVRDRNLLFIRGAYSTARLRNKKVVLDAYASYNDRTVKQE